VANNDVVVSGIRPTGVPHLGNLRGALQQWVDLQEKYPCFYFIADWHAFNIRIKAKTMHKRINSL